ncbi:divalent-cation tolerance protein CutA [Actinocorallia sp. API 0066]|uniref:divalent-cation tolerance protein CutA n=1 Tax=Actinocorallia sp. API 0066 TaxID=2896846 RepID=UPI001E418EA4|nr:divalent-cation tolerance protein CutA [Actinocorallia sp. API 0066]MCD0450401.1 divalent-cation tolerance protein CutA [Actinocorallia sp. API 0066]
MVSRHLEVHVTASSRAEAQSIVDAVVERWMAAGAQISGPISSTYWWQGEIHRNEEFLILMKTTRERLDDLVEVVRAMHSYDTPEIVAVPIEGGLADYLNWTTEETAAASPDG